VRLPYVRADACLGRQGDRLCIDATRRGRAPPRRLPGGSCSERPTRTFIPWIPWRSGPQRDPQASDCPDFAGAPTLYVSQSIFMPLNRFFMCLDRLERSSTETCGPGYAFSIGLDTLNTCNRILPPIQLLLIKERSMSKRSRASPASASAELLNLHLFHDLKGLPCNPRYQRVAPSQGW